MEMALAMDSLATLPAATAEAPAPAEAATEAAAGLLVGAEAVQAEEGGQPGKVGAAASFATSNCGGAATAS